MQPFNNNALLNLIELPLPEYFTFKQILESNTGEYLSILGYSHAIYIYNINKNYFLRLLNVFSTTEFIKYSYQKSEAYFTSHTFNSDDNYFAYSYETEHLSFITLVSLNKDKTYTEIFHQQFLTKIHFIKFINLNNEEYLLITFADKSNQLLHLNTLSLRDYTPFKYYSYQAQQLNDTLLLENRNMFSIFNLKTEDTIGVGNKFTPLYNSDCYQSIQLHTIKKKTKILTLDPLNSLITLNIISSRIKKESEILLPTLPLSKDELERTYVGSAFSIKQMKALLIFKLSPIPNSHTRLYEIDLNTKTLIHDKTSFMLSKYRNIKGIYYSNHHDHILLINHNKIIFFKFKDTHANN